MLELLLISQSPRRQDILLKAGFLFRVDTVKVSEIIEKNVNQEAAIEAVARAKVEAYVDANKHLKSQDFLALSADTVVVLGENILGKPRNREQAVEFLHKLSGKTHSVITGVCLWNLKTDEKISASARTLVKFRDLGLDEITHYVDGGEPMDKAGAYAIQGEGGKFVEKIEGDYDNVVGLPVFLVEEILQQKAWNVRRRKPSSN